MDDKKIIELFFSRDELAIAQCEMKYGHYCRSISFNIVGDIQDAEECTNDTYLQAWGAIPPTIPGCLQAFLGRIARNISLNLLKSKQTQKRKANEFSIAYEEIKNLLQDTQSIEGEIDAMVLRDAIEKFLQNQSYENRLIFVGRYWYFDSINEISHKLGISQSKTKMSLLRTRNLLKKFLKEEGIIL